MSSVVGLLPAAVAGVLAAVLELEQSKEVDEDRLSVDADEEEVVEADRMKG